MTANDPNSSLASSVESVVDDLTTLRDELRVQADLAGMELRDFVEKQEVKLQRVQSRLKLASAELEDRVPAVKSAAHSLVDEVRQAIADARSRLQED